MKLTKIFFYQVIYEKQIIFSTFWYFSIQNIFAKSLINLLLKKSLSSDLIGVSTYRWSRYFTICDLELCVLHHDERTDHIMRAAVREIEFYVDLHVYVYTRGDIYFYFKSDLHLKIKWTSNEEDQKLQALIKIFQPFQNLSTHVKTKKQKIIIATFWIFIPL